MSAETSTRGPDHEIERKIADAAKIGLPFVTALLALAAGVFVDVSTAVLILAGGVLVTVIAMFWASLRTLLGETPLSGADAYAIGAPPRAEEEQKRAVLRALKDLEFERSVGKISDEDYRALVAKYRAEAKRLLQLLDEDAAPGRERAEALVQKHLARVGLLEAGETGTDEEADEDSEAEAKPEAPAERAPKRKSKSKKARKEEPTAAIEPAIEAPAAERACAACDTKNDEDALFCKKCGARMSAPEARAAETDEEADAS